MSILYLDCFMGAAGDMLSAALLELLPDKEAFLAQLNNIGLPHTTVTAEPSVKCGIRGTHISVHVLDTEEDEHIHDHKHHSHDHYAHEPHCHDYHGLNHQENSRHTHEHHSHDHHDQIHHSSDHHHHSYMEEITHRISHLQIPDEVRQDILAVYSLLAQAESYVHGVPVQEIHFHEVGTLDALADITAVCLLIHKLKPTKILASPIHVGSGTVRCAHGILPVPAPATARLLKDIPIYSGDIKGELCTPTGAALLKHFVSDFVPMPTVTPTAVGYGMGKKDFPIANCVRAILGSETSQTEDVLELSCNLDDMTPEDLAFAMDILLEKGALDVYTTHIGMKKCRPGILLSVLCKPSNREEMLSLLFAHTTTLGIREQVFRRTVLERQISTVDSEFGPIRCKISHGYGVEKRKYESDDLRRIAKETGLSLCSIRNRLP